jgi:hypothetical protein
VLRNSNLRLIEIKANRLERIDDGGKETEEFYQWTMGGVEGPPVAGGKKSGYG